MNDSMPRRTQKGQRHLLDLDAPRPTPEQQRKDAESLDRVRRWVLSALAVTTLVHLVGGIILAAVFLERPTLQAQVGLNLIAGFFAVVAVVLARLIHGKNPVSWWLLLGLAVVPLGLWLTLR
ncbi:hypothetical protein [Nocardioides sp. CFH 31398]|uniref:hypothetical protein n=1 Tax=Nocardioides sp. CFH 31398 TaxID=2919579 RepID=UPI001F06920F|nr:hypothetical protein [Nocardioides sp. CFH 31398]MCH1866121.1 hypothetical protein [Nocardioides sp. CFH 31398]